MKFRNATPALLSSTCDSLGKVNKRKGWMTRAEGFPCASKRVFGVQPSRPKKSLVQYHHHFLLQHYQRLHRSLHCASTILRRNIWLYHKMDISKDQSWVGALQISSSEDTRRDLPRRLISTTANVYQLCQVCPDSIRNSQAYCRLFRRKKYLQISRH